MKNKYIIYLSAILKKNKVNHVFEHKFCSTREWRSDIALIDHGILIEFEGGMWTKSRHRTGKGYSNDTVKYNRAAIEGWVVLRYTTLTLGNAEKEILEAIERRGDCEL